MFIIISSSSSLISLICIIAGARARGARRRAREAHVLREPDRRSGIVSMTFYVNQIWYTYICIYIYIYIYITHSIDVLREPDRQSCAMLTCNYHSIVLRIMILI